MEFPKIVSGGQTGADRAALDWAIQNSVHHGGWCPKGRIAEDGPIPERYHLQETPSKVITQRTDWNVRDSDGTVIFTVEPTLGRGSRRTRDKATELGKPWLHLSQSQHQDTAPATLAAFIIQHGIRVLNVAGSRGSSEPGVGQWVRTVLDGALGLLLQAPLYSKPDAK